MLEIGFGMGDATATIAAARPEIDFLGIEVHPPGVGALLKRIGELGLANLRIVQHDAVEVLEHMVAPASLAGVHVFFPDPWHKLRHHKRRLVQPAFVRLLAEQARAGRDPALRHRLGTLRGADARGAVGRADPAQHRRRLRRTAGAQAADEVREPRPRPRPWRLGPGVREALSAAPAPSAGTQARQSIQPSHAVARTTMPKAMRYQAKGTKVWLAT